MKRVIQILVATVLVFASCKPMELSHIPAYETVLGLDFRPFAERGFLITPYSYNGKYISIALINLKMMPGAHIETTEEVDYMTQDKIINKKWITDTLETSVALERIYQYCIEMGADALVDFKISDVVDDYFFITPPTKITGKEISGFAIKRQD
jgi:hypothetical protein